MQPQVKAITCPKCKGTGLVKEGITCKNCRGVGLIGTDGTLEYYLKNDEGGNLIVSEFKSYTSTTQSELTKHYHTSQKRGIIRNLSLILVIIIYILFLALHFAFLKNPQIFSLITIIFIGILILVILYNSKLSTKVNQLIFGKISKEPDDFIKFMKNRTNRRN